MATEPEGATATLPPPKPPKKNFLLRVDQATAQALYELGGLRGELPGVAARHIVQTHAHPELQRARASRSGQGS